MRKRLTGFGCLWQVMAPNRKIFALKRIKLQGKDSEASKGFVDEITLLQRLRGKQNIIQLIDAEVRLITGCTGTPCMRSTLGPCQMCIKAYSQQQVSSELVRQVP